MIDPAKLHQQAANKYATLVPALLSGQAADHFPLAFRFTHLRSTASLADLRAENETVHRLATQHPTLEVTWRRVETRLYGANDLPEHIRIRTPVDYFAFLGRTAEWETIAAAHARLAEAFPVQAAQLPAHWRLFRTGDVTFWQQVIDVLRYFAANPFPACYARELPLRLSSKFFEQHTAILGPLLHLVAPHALREEGQNLAERLGLRTPQSLIQCRLLDPNLLPDLPFRHFSIPLDRLDRLAEIPAESILITENLVNLLTLPDLPRTLALFGQGYAVSRFTTASAFAHRRLRYWGDLDVHGFEILALLRRSFPHTESLLMDSASWALGHELGCIQENAPASRQDPNLTRPFLRPTELSLYEHLLTSHQRLEQEHLPLSRIAFE